MDLSRCFYTIKSGVAWDIQYSLQGMRIKGGYNMKKVCAGASRVLACARRA